MNEVVTIVPGNDKYVGACITDAGRPHPAHSWARAASHIFQFKDVGYFEQMEAATTCRHVVEELLKVKRPPQRAKVQWGWGKGWPGQ